LPATSIGPAHLDLNKILSGRASSFASFEAGVEAFSNDPNATYNTGINTTITLPVNYTPPSAGCAGATSTVSICGLVGVSERINSTLVAAVGVVLFWISGAPVPMAFANLPNGTLVTGVGPDELQVGKTYAFSFVHVHGYWWSFKFAGPTTGSITGGPGWANGTYQLGASVASAVDILGQGGLPTEFLDEFANSSFTLPRIGVPNAIGIERSGTSSTSYRPTSGNAGNVNASYPLGIEGRAENSSLSDDSVNEAGSLMFPGTAAPLWGKTTSPLGFFTPQAAVFTLESSVAGNEGIGFDIKVPATSLGKNQAIFVGANMPVNSTIDVGVGVLIYSGGAEPYCLDTRANTGALYFSSGPPLVPGASALLQVEYGQNGWWDFTENGAPIVNNTSPAYNGTAYLGLISAAGIVGTVHDVGATEFGLATFPTLGIYGNTSLGFLNASSALLIKEPGRGWLSPDYAQGWHWNPGMRVEANQQSSTIPSGETIFGTNATSIPSPITEQGALLWTGQFVVRAYVSSPTIVPGENATIYANVTSAFANPPSFTLCVSAGGNCSLSTYRESYGVNWSSFWANYTGHSLTSISPLDVTIYVNATCPPDYRLGSETLYLTVMPSTLALRSRTSSSVISAGNSTTLSIWVNDSLGPVTGAAIEGDLNPVSGQGYLGAISPTDTPGLYSVTFAPPVTLPSKTTYDITFYANATGAYGGSSQPVEVTVNPLPVLGISITVQHSYNSTLLYAGEGLALTATVVSGGHTVGGAEVKVNSTPVWWLTPMTGTTSENGAFSLNIATPTNITTQEGFIMTATASMAWHLSGATDATISVIPAIITGVNVTSSSSTVFTGQSITFTALGSCLPQPCPSSLTFKWATNNSLGNVSSTAGSSTSFTAGSTSGKLELTVTAMVLENSFSVSVGVTIVKQPASSSTTVSFFSGGTLWVVVACAVVVVALVAAFLAMRRRKSSKTPKDEAEAPETTTEVTPSPKTPSTTPAPPGPPKPPWSED
jgi:hypothetical protein